MKNKLKSIYKKYNNIKYSLLKNLNSRKTKIQVIWNQINSPNKENKLKTKNLKSKPNNQKVLFSNFEFSNLSFPKNFSNFSIIKSSLVSKFKKNKLNFDNLQKYFSKDVIKKFLPEKLSKKTIFSNINFKKYDEKFKKYLNFKFSDVISKLNTNKSLNKKKKFEFLVDFLGIFYINNELFFAHLQKKNKTNIIKDIVQIDAPSDLIGEYKIEKVPEFSRMINDMINVFELNNPPIILHLSSSFFTTRSFSDSELIVFSEEDPVILSKSPYLPDNTLIQYKRVNGDKNSSYHRVVYADKEIIDSWINGLSLTGSEIATVTCPTLHLVENLSNQSKKDILILCDIEDYITNVYVLRNNCELFSERLPFGSSVYITGNESLNDQFFSRLSSSVKSIISKNKLKFDNKIYLNGNGLDKMISLNNKLNDEFIEVPQTKYKLNPEKISTFQNCKSVLNSFSSALDILIGKELDLIIKKEDSKNQQIYRGQKYEQKNNEVSEKKKKSPSSLTYRGKDYKS